MSLTLTPIPSDAPPQHPLPPTTIIALTTTATTRLLTLSTLPVVVETNRGKCHMMLKPGLPPQHVPYGEFSLQSTRIRGFEGPTQRFCLHALVAVSLTAESRSLLHSLQSGRARGHVPRRKREQEADSVTDVQTMDSAPIHGVSEYFLFRTVT